MAFLFDSLYVAAGVLGSPYWLYKWARSEKFRAVMRGKFADPPERLSESPAFWMHCASVGEVLLARGLVAGLKDSEPGWETIISYNTPTAHETAAKHFQQCCRFYNPGDFSRQVNRALDRLRPSMLVLMELELWPNLVLLAKQRGIPVAVVNARITESSARNYRRFWPVIGRAFRAVDVFAAQNETYAGRLAGLGVDPACVQVTGSMKYDNLSTDEGRDTAMAKTLGVGESQRVIVGGCTYAGEDEALIDAYRELRNEHDGLRLILAPRHPERLDAVEAAITQAGFGCVRRSTLPSDGPAAEVHAGVVLLIDTVGELERIYSLASVVFVGGSLIPRGGHNMMEPAGRGRAVIVGPHTGNFVDTVADLTKADGLKVVSGADELRQLLDVLICDPERARAMGGRARGVVIRNQGATGRVVDLLLSLTARHS